MIDLITLLGHTVLIHGSTGAVGLSAVALAKVKNYISISFYY